jgi:hypothetical protein
MKVRLLLYKGWPSFDLVHTVSHTGICLRSLSIYSHVELEIDGVCYSSSARDKGVRSKIINPYNGKWVIIDLPKADANKALNIFKQHEGKSYDWSGVVRFVLPFVEQQEGQLYCSELVAMMLGLDHKDVFPSDLVKLTKDLQ